MTRPLTVVVLRNKVVCCTVCTVVNGGDIRCRIAPEQPTLGEARALSSCPGCTASSRLLPGALGSVYLAAGDDFVRQFVICIFGASCSSFVLETGVIAFCPAPLASLPFDTVQYFGSQTSCPCPFGTTRWVSCELSLSLMMLYAKLSDGRQMDPRHTVRRYVPSDGMVATLHCVSVFYG